MRHIKSIISKRLKSLSRNPEIDERAILKKIEEIVKQKSAIDKIEVLFYKNKEIGIKCFNSYLANELYLIQEEIKDEVNNFFNKKIIKKISFRTF